MGRIGNSLSHIQSTLSDFKQEVKTEGFVKAAKHFVVGDHSKQVKQHKAPDGALTKEKIQDQYQKPLSSTPTKSKTLTDRSSKQSKASSPKKAFKSLFSRTGASDRKEQETIRRFREVISQKLDAHKIPEAKKEAVLQKFDALAGDKNGFKTWAHEQQEAAKIIPSLGEDVGESAFVYDKLSDFIKEDPVLSQNELLLTDIGHGYDAVKSDMAKEGATPKDAAHAASSESFSKIEGEGVHKTATTKSQEEALWGYKAGLDYREQIRTDMGRLRSAKSEEAKAPIQKLIKDSRNHLDASINYLKEERSALPKDGPQRAQIDKQIADLTITLEITDSTIDGGFQLPKEPTRADRFMAKAEGLVSDLSKLLEGGSTLGEKLNTSFTQLREAVANLSLSAQINVDIKLNDLKDLLTSINDELILKETNPNSSDREVSLAKNLSSIITQFQGAIKDFQSNLTISRISTSSGIDDNKVGFSANGMLRDAHLQIGNALSAQGVGIDEIFKAQESFTEAFKKELEGVRSQGYSSAAIEDKMQTFTYNYFVNNKINLEEY